MMDVAPYQQQMDPKICAEQWPTQQTKRCSRAVEWILPIHPQIPFFQIKLPPQVYRFTMQTPPLKGRWETWILDNFFYSKSFFFNYLLFGVGQQWCLLNLGSNQTNPRLTRQEQKSHLSNWFEIDSRVGRLSIHNHYPSDADWKSTSRAINLCWSRQFQVSLKSNLRCNILYQGFLLSQYFTVLAFSRCHF